MSMQKWVREVSEVFDVNPRNGNNKSTIWFGRKSAENAFTEELYSPGRHICIDGSSGTGKSSLAITKLLECKVEYTTVQITKSMNWRGFCKELIKKPKAIQRQIKASAGVEWKSFFPKGKLELSVGRTSNEKTDYEYWERTVANATEQDICEALAHQNCLLLVDEFERANSKLVTSIAEMCKILTQTYQSEFAKLVIIGADNIYSRLFDAYSTLDCRIRQISIPTLPTPAESYRYLALGFRKLNKYYPGRSKFIPKEKTKECIECIYFAADGLFKSLTEIGREISLRAGQTSKSISPAIIERACKMYEKQNYQKYRDQFRLIFKLGHKNPAVVGILQFLNDRGIGQIHDLAEIEETIQPHFGAGLVNDAFELLWRNDFLVLTGESNEKVFMKNPTWAQTLRVYLSDEKKKVKLLKLIEKDFQLALPLDVKWNQECEYIE